MDPLIPDAAREVRVLVVSRDGCHLCEDAEATVEALAGELGVSWRRLDVDADPPLRAAYSDHVPVTFVDGVLFGRWFCDGDALRSALSRPAV